MNARLLVALVAALGLLATACGDGESSRDRSRSSSDDAAAKASSSGDDEAMDEALDEDEIDEDALLTEDGEPLLEPTTDGPDMEFGVIPTEWVSPPDLTGREAAVGLPDETGAFLFMVSLRKARFRGTFEDLRAMTAEVSTATTQMRPSPITHRPTTAFGLDDCELLTSVIEITEAGGRFDVGDQMRSRTWACIEDGMLYQASALEMAEADDVIARDILTLVNRAKLVHDA